MRESADATFAVVMPHSDDLSIFAGGLVRTLVDQGRRGCLIRVTNDEKDSLGLGIGETIQRIEAETEQAAELLGLTRVHHLNLQNHGLEHHHLTDLRHRLITLFRYHRVDTVISFHPTVEGEENPDHYLTGLAVDAACWMAGRPANLPEHAALGLAPTTVTDRWYVHRGGRLATTEVDVTAQVPAKRAALLAHRTPLARMWSEHCAHDPAPSATVEEYVERTFLARDDRGRHVERFHHVGPARSEKGSA